jgi:hypothetical protein
MRYFSCLYEIIISEIVNPLNRGDVTLKNIIKLTELFSAYLLVLLNKYRGLINIPKVTGKMCLGTATVSTS